MKGLWKKYAGLRYCVTALFGVLAGMLLMVFIMGRSKEEPKAQPEEQQTVAAMQEPALTSQEEPVEEEPQESVEAQSVPAGESQYPEWSETTVYNGGDTVIYKNRIYKAKWWTQGEQPDNADVWEDTKESPAAVVSGEESDREPVIVNSTASPDERFKVVVYYPSWEPDKLQKIDYSVVTHVNYAFAIPKEDGSLRELDNPETAAAIIKEAHANKRKALLAVGGWSYNDVPLEAAFMAATETPEKRKLFADNIIAMCKSYGFDGVDMDWEHPRVDSDSSVRYEELMLDLAQRLHEEGLLLTSAVLSGATADGNIYYDAAAHTNAVLGAVDWINVMAYDGGDGERHSSYEFAINSAAYWKDTRGMEASRIVLGVPFYSRPGWMSYDAVLTADENAWEKDMTNANGMEVWYNGIPTIQKKTVYAAEELGGIMVWEITQDTGQKEYSLLQAIKKAIEK